MIRIASKCAANTTLFYVDSSSRPGKEHTVIHIHTKHVHRWICSCETFRYRQLVKAITQPKQVRHCHHIRAARVLYEWGHQVA